MACGDPSCVAIFNVISVHTIIIVILIFSWVDIGNVSSFVNATALGFVTLLWFAISSIFIFTNLLVFLLDQSGCELNFNMRVWCAQYGCLFLTFGEEEEEDDDNDEEDDDDDDSLFETIEDVDDIETEQKIIINNHEKKGGRKSGVKKSSSMYITYEGGSSLASKGDGTISHSKYYRFILVLVLLAAEGFLIIAPYFPFTFVEYDLNNGLLPKVFDKTPRSDIELIDDAFDFIPFLYPGPLSLTGDYDNVETTARATTYQYKRDGTECAPACALDVIRPSNQSTLSPIIFYVHGGGWDDGDKSDPNTPIGFWLDRGYAFVSVQHRFPSSSLGSSIYDVIKDVEDAWAYIVDNGATLGLDATNAIFYGNESGGHLATNVAYRSKSTGIRGVINMYGITEWAYYINSGETKLKDKFFDDIIPAGLDITQQQEVYEDVSASNYVDQNSPPTLTIHGIADPIVPIEVNEFLHEVLTSNAVPNYLLEIPFETQNLDYGWYSKGGQITAFAMDQFFAMHFKSLA